ncbi:MAG: hypothetical protein ACJ0Q8_06865 [Candidatus Azotimanducaceae bacterium]
MQQTTDCPICNSPGQTWQKIPGYRLLVCDLCWQDAEIGWPKEAEPVLFMALAKAGLLIPDRNGRGLLPRHYSPPEDYAL